VIQSEARLGGDGAKMPFILNVRRLLFDSAGLVADER
jgi:hypothetical protein